MKKTTTLLLAMLPVFAFAKATPPTGPQVPYQAVARYASSNLISNQAVSLRFTIHDGTATGTNVFQETGSATTNEFGLFAHSVVTNTSLTGVNWASGAKFMQVEIDATGGTSYTDMGTQHMLYVPYAAYALTSGNGAGPTGPSGANGTNGSNGTNGATGVAGTNGTNGSNGTNGTAGTTGATGIGGIVITNSDFSIVTPPSSGAWVDLPGTVINLTAGKIYDIKGTWYRQRTTSTTANVNMSWVYSGTATVGVGIVQFFTTFIPGTSITSAGSFDNVTAGFTAVANAGISEGDFGGLVTATTSGTLKIQIQQPTANPYQSAGSYIMARLIN